MMIGSCGHRVCFEAGGPTEAFAVEYRGESCDAMEGYVPCVVSATYCRSCMVELAQRDEFIEAKSLSTAAHAA